MAQSAQKLEFTPEQLNEQEPDFYNFFSFCEGYLHIRDFVGNIVKLVPNRPQRRFIKAILKQWKEKGWIKVVIAKARKMGFTTIICAFIFWILYTNVTNRDTREAIAGTHEEASNPNLIKIMNLFYENLPDKLKLPLGKSNSEWIEYKQLNPKSPKELMIGATYNVKVASNVKKVGRSATAQMLHVSEIAHIDNASGLAASLLSVIGSNTKDSMIFLESTSNGMGNYHHEVFVDAISNKAGNKYLAFFAPWFEDERYIEELPEGFVLTPEEAEEKERYDLTDEQMCWRRSMMATFKGTPKQRLAEFRQEYPANWKESFAFSAVDSFLEPDNVIDAMNRPITAEGSHVPIIAAFDPSEKGRDRDCFGLRHGSNVFGIETPHFGENFESRVSYLKEKLDDPILKIDMLFVDFGGGGNQIVSRLHTDNYDNVRYIQFGVLADKQSKAHLKCDEMAVSVQEALLDKHDPLSIKVTDEQRDDVLQDLTAMGYDLDKNGQPKLESKKQLKSRGVRSTDIFDMVRLLYAQPIRKEISTHDEQDNDNSGLWFEEE
jgi:hypothetical protein